MRLKLVCIKNQNIRNKSKVNKNKNENKSKDRLPVRNVEIFKLQRESSQKGLKNRLNYRIFRISIRERNCKSFIRKFHGYFRIMEISELRKFERERVNCI